LKSCETKMIFVNAWYLHLFSKFMLLFRHHTSQDMQWEAGNTNNMYLNILSYVT
jgi:hypothetical protein